MTALKLIADPGVGREDDPIGSVGWAQRVRLRMQGIVNDVDTKPDALRRYVDLVQDRQAWTLMSKPDGSHFKNWDEFCEFRQPWGLGKPWKILEPFIIALKVFLGEVEPHQALHLIAGREEATSSAEHQSLGAGHGEAGATSGVDDGWSAAIADLYRRNQDIYDSSAATSLSALHGVRFGKLERYILLSLDGTTYEKRRTFKTKGESRSRCEAHNRAGRKLERLLLMRRLYGGDFLLPLGQKVVDAYRAELANGKRIRWPR